MQIQVSINNTTPAAFPESFAKKVISEAVRSVAGDAMKRHKISISVANVNQARIKELNKKYRRLDQVTDELSFAEFSTFSEIARNSEREIYLGELIVACAIIKKEANINKISFCVQLADVLAHGALHLLGFRHGKEMFELQEGVVHRLTAK